MSEAISALERIEYILEAYLILYRDVSHVPMLLPSDAVLPVIKELRRRVDADSVSPSDEQARAFVGRVYSDQERDLKHSIATVEQFLFTATSDLPGAQKPVIDAGSTLWPALQILLEHAKTTAPPSFNVDLQEAITLLAHATCSAYSSMGEDTWNERYRVLFRSWIAKRSRNPAQKAEADPRCACGAHKWGPNTTRITDANGQEHYREKCAPQVKTALCPHGLPYAENICGPCSQGRPTQPNEERYTMTEISYALNRSLYAKTGNIAIKAIIEDLGAALRNGGDHPMRGEDSEPSANKQVTEYLAVSEAILALIEVVDLAPEAADESLYGVVAGFLISIGWKPVEDAQWHNLRGGLPHLRALLSTTSAPHVPAEDQSHE